MDSDKIVNSGRISCGNKWRLDGAKIHRSLEVFLCHRKSITWMITSVLADQPKTGAALRCGPPAGSSPLDHIRRWNLSAKLICFNSHPQITFHCGLEECLGLRWWWWLCWWGISRYSLLSARMANEHWAVHGNSVRICRQRRRLDSWKLVKILESWERKTSAWRTWSVLYFAVWRLFIRQGKSPAYKVPSNLLFPIAAPSSKTSWLVPTVQGLSHPAD